eukprot:1195707-Prorocentrum_minimum.AAC.3
MIGWFRSGLVLSGANTRSAFYPYLSCLFRQATTARSQCTSGAPQAHEALSAGLAKLRLRPSAYESSLYPREANRFTV